MTDTHVGVILMTYGSPATLDDIPAYIKNVYGGRDPSEEVLTEFRRRYALIGGSPLIRITNEQAAALQEELNRESTNGTIYRVSAGMRFSPPFIANTVPEVASGADTLVGLIMSPQYSPSRATSAARITTQNLDRLAYAALFLTSISRTSQRGLASPPA